MTNQFWLPIATQFWPRYHLKMWDFFATNRSHIRDLVVFGHMKDLVGFGRGKIGIHPIQGLKWLNKHRSSIDRCGKPTKIIFWTVFPVDLFHIVHIYRFLHFRIEITNQPVHPAMPHWLTRLFACRRKRDRSPGASSKELSEVHVRWSPWKPNG